MVISEIAIVITRIGHRDQPAGHPAPRGWPERSDAGRSSAVLPEREANTPARSFGRSGTWAAPIGRWSPEPPHQKRHGWRDDARRPGGRAGLAQGAGAR